APRNQDAHDSTEHPNHRRLDEKDQLDLAILRADRLHDADLARAFEYGHDHRVRNPKRRDQQRDSTEQSEHRIDNQKNRPYLIDLIHDRKTAKPELGDLLSYCGQTRGIRNADHSRFITFVLTFAEISATTRE